MIGRAYLWGLAANGQAGVENVLDILRSGIDSALLGLGKRSVRELGPADLLVPAGLRAPARRDGRAREPRVRLGAVAWPQLDGGAPPMLVVPLGATEQHGPHLPLETDTRDRRARIADAAAAGRADVVVAPALPFGASDEHAGFPGTLSLGQEAARGRGRRARPQRRGLRGGRPAVVARRQRRAARPRRGAAARRGPAGRLLAAVARAAATRTPGASRPR